MSEVEKNLFKWTKFHFPNLSAIEPLREQASSRKYYRVFTKEKSVILVFSDPQKELNDQFVTYSEFLIKNNISVPRIEAFEPENGFMLIEDFGDKVLQYEINADNKRDLYLLAIEEIIKFQLVDSNEDIKELNEISVREQMELFEEWFLSGYLALEINKAEKNLIHEAYIFISKKFLGQKKVLCHFDFELRNLMLKEDGTIGVLDYQDLTYGPLTLDLVSLVKDIENPVSNKEIEFYLEAYLSMAEEAGIDVKFDLTSLHEDFDIVGLQRQLRILGTLSRLHLRDRKSFRLPDLRQTLFYVIEASQKYDALKEFSNFLEFKVKRSLEECLGESND